MAKKKLSHYDSSGRASMVDVSEKKATKREAEASALVVMSKAVLKALPHNPKGDPLEVARIAGIQAAKRTSELIPMCHPLPLSHVDVDIRLCENGVAITSRVTIPPKLVWRWKRWWRRAWLPSLFTICVRRSIKASRFAK